MGNYKIIGHFCCILANLGAFEQNYHQLVFKSWVNKQRCVPGNQYELAGKMREPWKNRPYFLAEKPVLFIGNNKIGHFSGRKCCTIFSNLLGSFMKSISCVCSKKCKQSCALLPGNQHLFAGKMRDPWQNTKSLKCWKDDVKANLEF